MTSIQTLTLRIILICIVALSWPLHHQAQPCAPITLNCPADVTITADPGSCGEIVDYVVSTNGDCPLQSLLQTDASGLTSGQEFPIGTTVQIMGVD